MYSALSGCSSIRLSAVRNILSVLPPSRHEKNVVQSNKKGSAFVIKEVKVICLVVFYLSLNLPALSLTECIACKVGLNIWHQLFYYCVFASCAVNWRVLRSANIAKGECNAKQKTLFWICIAESHPILCKYSERREHCKKQKTYFWFLYCRVKSYIMQIYGNSFNLFIVIPCFCF